MEPEAVQSEPRELRRSRPTSLLLPEREPINFQLNLVGAPSDVQELVEHIKHVAEQFLYHWKTFPIELPLPVCTIQAGTTTSDPNGARKPSRAVNLRDLFIAPLFDDELEAVATDNHGEPRRLTFNQLRTLRDRGEFEVASLNFPGQSHKWQLSQFLQKGTERTYDSLLSDLALAARFIVVTAISRVTGHFLSLKNSVASLFLGLLKICDAVVGLPSLLAQDLEHKMNEERCRFLVAELECQPNFEDFMDTLTTYVRKELRRAETEKYEMECDSALPVPYVFLTPKGQEIDLRLFSKETLRKALPILGDILEKETRGWFLHFRERLIAELREKKLSDQEIQEEVSDAVMKEYLQRVYNAILSNAFLKSLGHGIPELFVQQAQSVVIMHKAVNKIHKDINIVREDHTHVLHETYPILSRVTPWLRSKQNAVVSTKLQDSTWSVHEEAIKECAKHNLQQSIYFLSRDLAFTREREQVLLKELKNAKTPTRNFKWPCRIWSPKSWPIKCNFQGHSEQIPTVISQQTTSIVTPRSDPSQPVYLVEKEVSRATSTRWPFWRIGNLIMRTWCWTWNAVFLLLVVVPWCSPVGLRALFCIEPFMPDLELSQVNGTLFPRKTSITQTMASRLLELWRGISKSRTHFESEPDTGFVGKGITRNINRVWNYLIKGCLGTTLIVILFPILCLSITGLSIVGALTAPIWVPLITLGLHLLMMVGYDLDCPDDSRNRYGIIWEALLWNILLQGCLQPVLAAFVAAAICPAIAAGIGLVGLLRYGSRMVWDSITYHVFIKKYGRVPASDSLAVQRIEGPGLNGNYFFLITPEQALAAFEAKMEADELQTYKAATEALILQPQRDFTQFVDACFGSFSAQLAHSGPFKHLERESHELMAQLAEKLEKRQKDLQTGLAISVKTKIKMTTTDLKISIQEGAHLLERFYPGHVLAKLSGSVEDFWESKGLSVGDWAGLAGMLYVDIFSLEFLTPIGDKETTFKLEPLSQLDLSRYTEMVRNAIDIMGVNGPDLLGNLYAPRGNIQIKSPFLEVTAFNPRSKITTKRNTDKQSETIHLPASRFREHPQPQMARAKAGSIFQQRPWKRQQSVSSLFDKLIIPLPIPHPASIAILIYNRDSEQPIPLDNDISTEILRSIENCQKQMDVSHLVQRFRGGTARGAYSSVESMASRGTSYDSQLSAHDSLDDGMAGTSETLPCGVVDRERAAGMRETLELEADKTVQWTLGSWAAGAGGAHQPAAVAVARGGQNAANSSVLSFGTHGNPNSNTVRVDLASPEDISLDTDSSRAVYGNNNNGTFGTTV